MRSPYWCPITQIAIGIRRFAFAPLVTNDELFPLLISIEQLLLLCRIVDLSNCRLSNSHTQRANHKSYEITTNQSTTIQQQQQQQ